MLYFVMMVLSGIYPYLGFMYNQNTDKVEEIDLYHTTKEEFDMDEEAALYGTNFNIYTIEGTITRITFADSSKTIRVKRWGMHLYLTTPDSPNEELEFTKRPVLESDRQLRVGQRVSITALKDERSGWFNIWEIHPL